MGLVRREPLTRGLADLPRIGEVVETRVLHPSVTVSAPALLLLIIVNDVRGSVDRARIVIASATESSAARYPEHVVTWLLWPTSWHIPQLLTLGAVLATTIGAFGLYTLSSLGLGGPLAVLSPFAAAICGDLFCRTARVVWDMSYLEKAHCEHATKFRTQEHWRADRETCLRGQRPAQAIRGGDLLDFRGPSDGLAVLIASTPSLDTSGQLRGARRPPASPPAAAPVT